ncbi:MAG: class I SAM-dependent methyltransferase [Proteobacteria bacterium]|nr:class I SAM-dependent methyltransferase [Pseudomonadota bacterium]
MIHRAASLLKPRDDRAGIGFTAHYTSQVWVRNGLSHPALGSATGRFLHRALRPPMWMGKNILGISDLDTYLLQRHHILDFLMDRAVEQGAVQVLEPACGLSPRGFRFMARHGARLRYVEADLPAMAARKRELLDSAGLLAPGHQVVETDILAQGGEHSLEAVAEKYLDPDRPVILVTEGLVNYFDFVTMQTVWERMARILSRFPWGLYLADIVTGHGNPVSQGLLKTSAALMAWTTGAKTWLHFRSADEVARTFRDLGFDRVQAHEPEPFFRFLPLPRSRRKSFIRVLAAEVR